MQSISRPNAGPDTGAERAPAILALDTSTERLAVAAQGPVGAFHSLEAGGALASARLLPQVNALLAQAGLAYADLGFIAFGRGPGAFTGLRTACAVAQGIALALDVPVLPLDSLLVVAEDARAQRGADAADCDIAVAMDARMDEVYAGVYRCRGGHWSVLQAPGLFSLAALQQAWSALDVDAVAGSALAAFGERLPLPTALREPARQLAQEHDRAAALLRLALQAAAEGAACDAAQALPLYLRDKVAQTSAEREAIKAAQAAGGAPAR